MTELPAGVSPSDEEISTFVEEVREVRLMQDIDEIRAWLKDNRVPEKIRDVVANVFFHLKEAEKYLEVVRDDDVALDVAKDSVGIEIADLNDWVEASF